MDDKQNYLEVYKAEINNIANQLCKAVDDDFDFMIKIDSSDIELQKLGMLTNYLLDNVRRSIGNIKSAYERVILEETQKNAILINAPYSIIVFDRQYNILLCNPKTCSIFNEVHSDLIRNNINKLLASKCAEKFRKIVQQMNSGDDYELDLVLLDGSQLPVSINGSRFCINNATRTLCILRDLTEIKEKEQRVAEMQQQMTIASRKAGQAEIASDMLHNVGNILNSVKVSIDQVEKKTSDLDAEKIKKLLMFFLKKPELIIEKLPKIIEYIDKTSVYYEKSKADIFEENQKLKERIYHIESIMKTQQKYARCVVIKEEININNFINEIIELQAPNLNKHGVQIQKSLPDIKPIIVDKHKLMSILVNFINNAKDAVLTNDAMDRRISIKTEMFGKDNLSIVVADNGCGIKEENKSKMFSHGFTTKKDGHGFGLHSCAIAAKELGGSIELFSKGENLGASANLILPFRNTEY